MATKYSKLGEATGNAVDITAVRRDLLTRLEAKREELARSVAKMEALKMEIVAFEHEYVCRVERVREEASIVEEEIFYFRKLGDLLAKGHSLQDAKKILNEREAARRRKIEENEEDEAGASCETGESPLAETEKRLKDKKWKEARAIWKRLACKFHPDLTQDEAEKTRRESIMKRINDAYVRGDVTMLLSMEETSSTENKPLHEDEQILTELLAIARSIDSVKARTEAFKKSHWYKMLTNYKKEKRHGSDNLTKEEKSAYSELEAKKKELAALRKKYV